MRRSTARRWAIFVRIVVASMAAGGPYGAIASYYESGVLARGVLTGAANGLLIGGPISAVEIFVARTRLGRLLEQAPFMMTVLIKALAYGALIMTVLRGDVAARLLLMPPSGAAGPLTTHAVEFSVGLTLLFIFLLQVGRIVGGRTLRDIVLGRYHRPRREERFFLFVDIAGSTPLAERIGPVAVHRFLDRVFRLASDPIDDHRGEIYQYVGDEMVITWRADEARASAAPLACFFAIERALAGEAPAFTRDFGAAPRLRGALHAGPVVSGEVGESRRAIVFHGDVMNTAARLEQAARELEHRFLVSADALARLPALEGYALQDLGPQRLRGRAAPVRVYVAEAK